MARGLAGFDRRYLGGAPFLAGIDEAGRGCLAGPVVAAALRCEAAFYASPWCRRHSRGVDDSKVLSAAQRAAVVERFSEARARGWIRVGIGTASVEEIERHNIYHATTLAMRRALAEVLDDARDPLWQGGAAPAFPLLIDGRPIRAFPLPHTGVVKGDRRSLAIALAGIHAKEWRDARMRELDAAFPQYGFVNHKGYGTEEHLAALRAHGPCPHHRPSFLSGIDPGSGGPDAASQGSLF